MDYVSEKLYVLYDMDQYRLRMKSYEKRPKRPTKQIKHLRSTSARLPYEPGHAATSRTGSRNVQNSQEMSIMQDGIMKL